MFSAYGELYYRETLLHKEALLAKTIAHKYVIPNEIEHKNFIDHIETLPGVDSPEIFGLNPNADIAFRTKETKDMIMTLMGTRPKESSDNSGLTREEQIQKKSENFLKQIKYEYPMHKVKKMIS